MTSRRSFIRGASLLPFASPLAAKLAHAAGEQSILNVSYDPTRELYRNYNLLYQQHLQETNQAPLAIRQSHGGSGKQSLAVQHGLAADVVTLALAADIDALNRDGRKLIDPNWQSRLPQNSTPYTSTIVFLVRKGNPKAIKDWADLIRDDVAVVTPNPKTSGGARWNFLAAWAYALGKHGQSEQAAQDFLKQLFTHVPVLDTGARGATLTFTERHIGDVLIAWENEAYLSLQASDEFEVVRPSISILCEPPVAVVDAVVDKRGTRDVATAYLEYLYSDAAQQIIADNFYRPRSKAVLAAHAARFPKLDLVTIDEAFGGWQEAQQRFFASGGVFDKIYG